MLGAQLLMAANQVADPYAQYNTLIITGKGPNNSTTIVDISQNPKPITVNGNAKITTTQSKYYDSSLSFDGSSSYLSIPANSELNLATTAFTLEMWIRFASNANSSFISQQTSTNGWQNVNWFIVNNNGRLGMNVGGSNTGVEIWGCYGSIPLNSFMHLVIQRSSLGLWFVAYNGVPQTLTNPGGSGNINGGNNVCQTNIGGFPGWGTNLNGNINDLRLTYGITRYSGTFTPPLQLAS